MKILKISSAILALVIVSAASADTQSNTYYVRGGINYLLDKDAKDFAKSNGFVGAIGYQLPAIGGSYGPSANSSIEGAWSHNEGHGNKFDSYGLWAFSRTPFKTGGSTVVAKGFSPYWGLGIGAVRNQVKGSFTTSASNGSGGTITTRHNVSESKWALGYSALVGAKLNDMLFLEAAYNFNGSVNGTNLNSATISLGVKF